MACTQSHLFRFSILLIMIGSLRALHVVTRIRTADKAVVLSRHAKRRSGFRLCFGKGSIVDTPRSSRGKRLHGTIDPARGSNATSTRPSASLEWDTFEFGESPKLDSRFSENSRQVFDLNEDELESFANGEQEQDIQTAERLNRQSEFASVLSPQLVEHATNVLLPFVRTDRVAKIDRVLAKRTGHCRFLFENPANPSNVWACLRTIDSFGIQHVDLVIESQRYQGKAALAQKRGMRTAMGSAQWLTLRNHVSTSKAVEALKNQGYRLYASDLNPDSKDIRDIDWNQEDKPICIVMGNENDGISESMRSLADETFTLPMSGFAESFNLSVATAITLAHLSACSKNGQGPLRPGDMDAHEVNCLRLRGIINSLSQKRLAKALLAKEGIDLPRGLGWIQ